MSRGSRVGIGGLQGAAGGAGIGTAIAPGIGTLIGGGIGGLVGMIGGAFGDDGMSDEDIQKQREFMARRQGLQNRAYDISDDNDVNAMMAKGPAGMPTHGNIFQQDVGIAQAPLRRQLRREGDQLEQEQFEFNAKRQQDAQEPGWQDWVGPILGAGAAVAGGFKSDPRAYQKQNLAGAADEASFIRSQPLSGDALQTALEENDERTKAALFGSRHRMSAYDF